MDLFEKEQRVYEDAFNLVNEAKNGAQISFEFFETLAKEYGKLLRHVRRVTKISDKNTIDLFANNVDLKNKVHYDSLTGLFNRRYLEDMLKQNIRELSRSDRVLSLLMLDVDFFKKFNDTYGHNEGDNCLRSIAETLSQCVFREDDFAARYGGEEFVVVLPYTEKEGACFTADRVLQSIRNRSIPNEKSEVSGIVTVSIGVTTVNVKHNHNGLDYIKCADKALYQSKQSGRNKYTFIEYKDDNV